MNVTKDFRNEFLKRKEVSLVITSKENPGINGGTKAIAENFKVDENVIVVKAVRSRFGRDSFLIEAFIYDSVEDKNEVEPRKEGNNKKGEAVPSAGGAN